MRAALRLREEVAALVKTPFLRRNSVQSGRCRNLGNRPTPNLNEGEERLTQLPSARYWAKPWKSSEGFTGARQMAGHLQARQSPTRRPSSGGWWARGGPKTPAPTPGCYGVWRA